MSNLAEILFVAPAACGAKMFELPSVDGIIDCAPSSENGERIHSAMVGAGVQSFATAAPSRCRSFYELLTESDRAIVRAR